MRIPKEGVRSPHTILKDSAGILEKSLGLVEDFSIIPKNRSFLRIE
jgi:hypothetical protein